MSVRGGVAGPESFAYTLTLGGRYAGTQEWVVRPERSGVVTRVQTEFGGALPAARKVQESRLDPASGQSVAYAEAEGGNRRPHFETLFDAATGLVTLRQGKDEATQPLVEGYHDPLSLLLWLRSRPQEATSVPLTVRMVGGRVHVQALPDSDVHGLAAHVYFLRPGGAYVYVERDAPHRLLRLIQPSDFGPVEALLTLEHAGARREHSRAGGARDAVRGERPQPGKPRRRR